MSKDTVNDFEKGEKVFHLSNSRLVMIVINIEKDKGEVTCRWVTDSGDIRVENFLAEELGIASSVSITRISKPVNRHKY